jgi:hypothetical protein
LNEIHEFRISDVTMEKVHYKALGALRVSMSSGLYQDIRTDRLNDRPFRAWLPVDFCNGTIGDVASVSGDDAPEYARGFIGLGKQQNRRPSPAQSHDAIFFVSRL